MVSLWSLRSLNFFLSAIAAMTAIVAIIWKPHLSYASLLNEYVSITIILSKQEGCIMLFTCSCFNCRNEKGLLKFVSERIKLVCRINNTRYNFQKNKLTFKHLKPQFIGRIVSLEELWKYMIFYTLPWSRWNRTHKYVRCTVRDSQIRSEMSWSSITLKMNP